MGNIKNIMERDMKSEILSCVQRRIASGAGYSGGNLFGGAGLLEHSAMGSGRDCLMESHAAPLIAVPEEVIVVSAAAKPRRKRGPNKKKVVKEAEVIAEMVAAPAAVSAVEPVVVAAGKKKRVRKAKAVSLEAKLAEPAPKAAGAKKANPWMAHLASVWAVEKKNGLSYSDAMKKAKTTYKK
jgi:hypothetical protein